MKHTLFIFAILTASIQTFAQSPRIKLNQITKDTVKGSVLISSPSDSGMVYSRDFYIAYGADTVLILYGDTLAATSGIISSVLSDGVTITGDGTTGNELKVDTSLIATIKALNDSLSTISASTTPDGVTITGDGSVGNPLKVDTATVISTIQGLVDTLTARNYLTANQTITLSGDVTGSGTTSITATVVDDSHNHIISNVDFLQDSLNIKINTDFSNVTGTLPVANGGTGATTLTGAGIVTGTGTTNYLPKFTGSTTVGNSNLINDLNGNLGLGVTPSDWSLLGLTVMQIRNAGFAGYINNSYNTANTYYNSGWKYIASDYATLYLQGGGSHQWHIAGSGTAGNAISFTQAMRLDASGRLGIGETSPSQKLDVNGKVKIQDLTGTGGNAVYENGGVLGVASDARFKTYVGDIQNGIALINQLKPKYFIDNRNSSFQQLGFYAQEVKSVINEASYPIGNTDYLGINDRAILATTVKAIQEQQAIIETQQQTIIDLQTTIQALITRIENLENK